MTAINVQIKRKQSLVANLQQEIRDLRAQRNLVWNSKIEANKAKKAERELKAQTRATVKAEKEAVKAAKLAEREAVKAERVMKLELKLAALKAKKEPMTAADLKKSGGMV